MLIKYYGTIISNIYNFDTYLYSGGEWLNTKKCGFKEKEPTAWTDVDHYTRYYFFFFVGFWVLSHLRRDLSQAEKKMLLQAEQLHK